MMVCSFIDFPVSQWSTRQLHPTLKEALRSSGGREFLNLSSSGMHQELVSTGNVRKEQRFTIDI